jgi:hypothetical protein
MHVPDLWKLMGSSQIAELTALITLILSLRASPQPPHFKKSLHFKKKSRCKTLFHVLGLHSKSFKKVTYFSA